MLKFETTCVKQGIAWGVISEGTIFPPSYYYLIFLICTFLSHRKFRDNFLIASNFDTLYL
jgi:hypothetical protein